jgi:hypothetical protein
MSIKEQLSKLPEDVLKNKFLLIRKIIQKTIRLII